MKIPSKWKLYINEKLLDSRKCDWNYRLWDDPCSPGRHWADWADVSPMLAWRSLLHGYLLLIDPGTESLAHDQPVIKNTQVNPDCLVIGVVSVSRANHMISTSQKNMSCAFCTWCSITVIYVFAGCNATSWFPASHLPSKVCSLWCYDMKTLSTLHFCKPRHAAEQTVELSVIWDAVTLMCLHCPIM